MKQKYFGPVAQLVEQFPFKEWVTGSNPVGLTNEQMKKAIIKNISTGITKNCDILSKNDNFLEVVLEGTTIKIKLKKKSDYYIGTYKNM